MRPIMVLLRLVRFSPGYFAANTFFAILVYFILPIPLGLATRAFFNALAGDPKARLPDWVEAYHHGQVKVTGEPAVVKLLGNVIERQLARAR